MVLKKRHVSKIPYNRAFSVNNAAQKTGDSYDHIPADPEHDKCYEKLKQPFNDLSAHVCILIRFLHEQPLENYRGQGTFQQNWIGVPLKWDDAFLAIASLFDQSLKALSFL